MAFENNSAKVIPDRILEDFHCKRCLKYLTIAPILSSYNGANVCGRCQLADNSKTGEPLLILTDDFSKYDQFAIPFLLLGYQSHGFKVPCVNRFDGCRALLSYSDIQNHEENCLPTVHDCPYCHFSGVGTQMINHFNQIHKRYCQNVINFKMNLLKDFFDTFLYRLDNILIFVQIFFDIETSQIFVESKSISALNFVGKIRLNFKIGSKFGFSQFQVVSDSVLVSKDSSFVISFKFEEYHFLDAELVFVSYKVTA